VFQYRRTVPTKNGKTKMLPGVLWACYFRGIVNGVSQVYRKSGPKMGFETQAAALAWRTKEEAKAPVAGSAPPTFTAAVETYIDQRERAGKETKSYQYLMRVEKTDKRSKSLGGPTWCDAFKEKKLDAITSVMITNQLNSWQASRNWTGATRNRALAQLSGFLSYCYGQRWIDAHPTEHGRVANVEEAGRREGYMTVAELEKVIGACEDWLGNIVRFGATTGMRLSEITSLTKSSYQTALVKGKAVPCVVIPRPKNRQQLVYPLAGWALDHVEERAKACTFPAERLFPGSKGGDARTSILRDLPDAVKAAGLTWGKYEDDGQGGRKLAKDGITFHSLRHSMATLAKENGLSVEEIMALGNWRSRSVVEAYAKTTSTMMVNAAAKMAAVVQIKDKKANEAKEESA
jgi:integrase